MEYTAVFQPAGCRGTVSENQTVLDAARKLGAEIETPCGGAQMCGKCKVKIEAGFFGSCGITSGMAHLSPVSEREKKLLTPEELAAHYRLACCATIQGDIAVYVPEQSRAARQIILENGQKKVFKINPAVRKYEVELDRPTLEDYRDDADRLKAGLPNRLFQRGKDINIDYSVLKVLPDILRQNKWKVNVTIWKDSEIIAVEPQDCDKAYGIAMDIGTTTLAAYLCDLATGEVLSQDSLMNSQVRYGDDVISRITYCMLNDDGLEKLNQLIIDDINTLVKRLTKTAGITPQHVFEIVLVFNTVMHHIALNLNPISIGTVPFVSVIRQSLTIKARELGIGIAQAGYIHCLPIEAGFVGADNVAVLIAEEPYKQEQMVLVIDIGTNGEINLGNRNGVLAASCATGPALEGAQIKYGMRAAAGAIEGVIIDAATGEPEIKIIGGYVSGEPARAKGICGSGIIDAVAEMFKAGILYPDGKFNKKVKSARVRQGADGKFEYVLAWAGETAIGQDITINQKDVRAVQLAKAALYAGAKLLMRKKGIENVDRVILAGAFGSYINKENAMVIGMFPDCELENVIAVGNAAGEGAKVALMDVDKRVEAEAAAKTVHFIETATEPDFQKEFYTAMSFPHAVDPFPHVQHILDQIPDLTD
ncbi:MAG: ASKHA domain-containing protein [Veillonellales bacterium]